MHSPAIHSALASARIDELHSNARPVVSPRTANAVRSQVRRCAAAMATCLRITVPRAPATP